MNLVIWALPTQNGSESDQTKTDPRFQLCLTWCLVSEKEFWSLVLYVPIWRHVVGWRKQPIFFLRLFEPRVINFSECCLTWVDSLIHRKLILRTVTIENSGKPMGLETFLMCFIFYHMYPYSLRSRDVVGEWFTNYCLKPRLLLNLSLEEVATEDCLWHLGSSGTFHPSRVFRIPSSNTVVQISSFQCLMQRVLHDTFIPNRVKRESPIINALRHND
jgi:hypothetical protein